MRGFLKYFILFCLPIGITCCAILLLPLDKRFAYNFVEGECSGHGKWLHDRLHENENPIDIALVGSSVGWGAFDDRTLSAMLSDSLYKEITVANLSFCRPGLNMRSLIVEELIRTKKPTHIVMELRAKPNMGGHPTYGFLAETQSVISPATRLYQAYPTDLKKALSVRWEQLRQKLYPKDIYTPDKQTFGIGVDQKITDREFMNDVKERRLKKDPFPKQTIQEKIHFRVYWENLEHIAALCKENNIHFSLCYINSIGRASTVPEYRERLESIAEIWYPADSISQNPAFYSDIVHYNESGMNALTSFLFQKLVESERSVKQADSTNVRTGLIGPLTH